MNRFLKFCGWMATAFCGLVGVSGLFTPQIGIAVAFIVCAVVLAPPLGLLIERVDSRISAGMRATAIVVVLFAAGATAPPTPSTPVAQSAVSTPVARCEAAGGKIWTGVKLHEDSQCKRLFATVLGGGKRDGEALVQIRFESGEIEWKTRSGVRNQAFVLSDDPAIKAQRWEAIQP